MVCEFHRIGTAYRTPMPHLSEGWTLAESKGRLVIDPAYRAGLQHIRAGQRIMVLFYFHRSPPFSADDLTQPLPDRTDRVGVFSLRSPLRPNGIGVSVLEVVDVDRARATLHVKGMDMFDQTPILDIKPFEPQ